MQSTSGVTPSQPRARHGLARRLRGPASAWLLGLLAVAAAGFAAQDRYEYDAAGRLVRHVDGQDRVIEYRYDPPGNLVSVQANTVDALRPRLNSLAPAVVRRDSAQAVVLGGERLQNGTLVASHPGLRLSGVQGGSDRIDAQLAVAADVPVGAHTLRYSNSVGSAEIALQVAPALPTINLEPSPLALPPDGVTRQVVLRLSHADTVAHTVTISSSDATRGTVSPASLTLAAGQTSAQVSVTPKAAGFFTLSIGSSTLVPASVPVFVTADFRGVNTSHAQPVGVRVGEATGPAPRTAQGLFGANGVGVTVGSVLTQVAPKGLTVGGSHAITLKGHGLPEGVQLAVVPATGATLSVQGATREQVRATLILAPDAPAGWRRIEARHASGALIPQASPDAGLIQVTTGQPELVSIDPLFTERNRVATLRIRGRHLQNGQVRITPSTDLRVDAAPVISADGTELSVRVEVVVLAALGARTVQVVTPSGESTAEPRAANQFSIVSQVSGSVTPIASPLVGVQVGTTTPAPAPQPFGPVLAQAGVLVGSGAWGLSPGAGIVGTEVLLEVSGAGLQGVRSAVLQPADGLTLGTPSISADGTRLTLPVGIATDAPKTPRRLVLTGASGAVPFTRAGGEQFAVVAPLPELMSTQPQVWQAGQTVAVTVRGRYLQGVQSIALSPADGVTLVAPFTSSADGTSLSFNAQVAANAPSGARQLRITTLAGSSAAEAGAANTITVARQINGAVTPIASALVGVRVGDTGAPAPTASVLAQAAPVGVLVNTIAAPVQRSESPRARPVGVLVGAAGATVSPGSPEGLLKGSSATVLVQGHGLDAVTTVAITGTGVSAGTPVASADGTRLSVPLTAAADAASGAYGLRLLVPAAGGGTRVLPSVDGAALSVHVGQLPERIDSVSPIVLEQGKAAALTVRGQGLRDVFGIAFEPAAGITQPSGVGVSWSTDAFGEKLSVPVLVAPDAPIGGRVLRLRVPGGLSTADALPANTLTVVAPQ